MKNIFYLLMATLMFLTFFLVGCDKKHRHKNELTENNTNVVRLQFDSTVIAYGDIAFGMSPNDLLQTNHFKNKHINELKSCKISDSFSLVEELQKNNINVNALESYPLSSKYDIKLISTVEQIGLYDYTIEVIFINNHLTIVGIPLLFDNEIQNIVDVVSVKYKKPLQQTKHKPILSAKGKKKLETLNAESEFGELFFWDGNEKSDFEKLPKLYCLYEWNSEHKKIRIFHFHEFIRSENIDPKLNINIRSKIKLEISNNNNLNHIIDYFNKLLLSENENDISIKKNAAKKF